MAGLWTAFLLMVQVTVAGRQPWIEPLPGVRLEPTRPVRTEADFGPDSAYRLLAQAARVAERPGFDEVLDRWQGELRERPQQAARMAEVVAILREAEPYLALARRAAVAADAQMPTDDSWCAAIPGLFTGTRSLARSLVFSARVKEGQGDPAGALGDLLVCIRCGNILSRGGGMGNHLVDRVISLMAAEAMHSIVTRNEVPAPVLRRYAQELLQVSDNVEPYAEAVRHEARQRDDMLARLDVVAGMVGGLMRGAGGDRVYWLIARGVAAATGSTRAAMRRDIAALHQHYVQLATQPYGREVDAQFRALPPPLDRDVARLFFRTEDSGGLFFAHYLRVSLSAFAARAAERDAVLRGMALFLAVRAYETEQRRPPILAADLVPEFLPRIPLDPFDGQPFRYVFGKVPVGWGDVTWGLYSVGRDFTDDGGRLPDPPHIGCQGRDKPPCDAVWIPRIIPDK